MNTNNIILKNEKKTLVFTATYNESENIEEFLNSTIKLHEVDVLIIDDNSPDETPKIIETISQNELPTNKDFIKEFTNLISSSK